MAKTLVAYFSATGTTEHTAGVLARELGADLAKIAPTAPYTAADLDWNDKDSRSTQEMNDAHARPALATQPGDLSAYDTVLIGFPIWWYVAPRIVETWIEAADLANKTVITFATSGGSGMGQTTAKLAQLAPQASWHNGQVLHGDAAAQRWASSLEL